MLQCNNLEVEAYSHPTYTSETMQSLQPSPFISHTLVLAPMTVFDPISSLPLSLISPEACAKLCFPIIQLVHILFPHLLPIFCSGHYSHTNTHFITPLFLPLLFPWCSLNLCAISLIHYISWSTFSTWPALGILAILQLSVLLCRCVFGRGWVVFCSHM